MDVAAKDPSKINLLNIDVQEAMELYKLYTTESFNDLLAYIQKQKEAIINLVQVPPIVAGTVDNSNRSNSEIQARYTFYNTIKAFNNIIKEELDSEFLPKIGWKGVEFKFGETDRRNETDILKNAKVLREDLHFTQDAVLEYLKQNGFKIPEVKKIFDEKMEEINKPQSNSSDFPSREPRSKSGIPKNEATRIEDKQMGVSSDAN
jgi:capsid portal protein